MRVCSLELVPSFPAAYGAKIKRRGSTLSGRSGDSHVFRALIEPGYTDALAAARLARSIPYSSKIPGDLTLMKRSRSIPLPSFCAPALTLALAAAFLPNLAAQSGEPHKGSVERIKVHGKGLEGNLSGDSADRDVSIYLPPSYKTDSRAALPGPLHAARLYRLRREMVRARQRTGSTCPPSSTRRLRTASPAK